MQNEANKTYKIKQSCEVPTLIILWFGFIIGLCFILRSMQLAEIPPNRDDNFRNLVTMQRLFIAERIQNSSHAKIFYTNKMQSKLKQLTPETSGTPARFLIVSQSPLVTAFLSDILDLEPGNLNSFTTDHQSSEDIIDDKQMEDTVEKLKDYFSCNIQKLDRNMHNIEPNVRKYLEQCTPYRCPPQLLQALCSLFPIQTATVTTLSLTKVAELLKNHSLRVHVLYVVRDMRAGWCSHRNKAYDLKFLKQVPVMCQKLEQDFVTAGKLLKKCPKRFIVARFEDLTLYPHDGIMRLLQFLGLAYDANIKYLLDRRVAENLTDSTFLWKRKLNQTDIEMIQSHCGQAMKSWGYRPMLSFSNAAREQFHSLARNKFNKSRRMLG